MGAVAAWLQADLRRRWASWTVLAGLLGLFLGGGLLAVSGARRTQTAEGRFITATKAGQVLITPVFGSGMEGLYDQLRRLPEVADLGVVAGEPLLKVSPAGDVDASFPAPNASADGHAFYTVYRPNLRAGRMPRPDRPYEALASVLAAQREHLHVGSRLQLRDLTDVTSQLGSEPTHVTPDQGKPVTLTIVGIGVFSDDVVASAGRAHGESASGDIYLTPAYYSSHGGPKGAVYDGANLLLRPGTDQGRLRVEIDAIAARDLKAAGSLFQTGAAARPGPPPGAIDFGSLVQRSEIVQRAVRPQAVALAAFGIIVGIAAVAAAGQALARELMASRSEVANLAALGMARTQLVAAFTLPAAGVALAAGATGVVLAVAASSTMPIGPARLAEPHPGVAANVALLGGGVVLVVVALVGRISITAWRLATAAGAPHQLGDEEAGSFSSLADTVVRSGLPAPAAVGVRMALPGRRAVGSVVGGAVAVATVVAAIGFSADLGRLFTTPARYGWSWDFAVDGGFTPLPSGQARALLDADPAVGGYAGGDYGNLTVAGRSVPTVGIDQLRGDVFPSLLAGRAPRGSGEIALGSASLRHARAAVGDAVRAEIGNQRTTLRVVGRAVFPDFERGGFVPTDLGEGAAVPAAVLAPEGAPPGEAYGAAQQGPAPEPAYNFYLVRFRPGADVAAARGRLQRAYSQAGCPPPVCTFHADRKPADVVSYSRVRWTPPLLAGLLAGLAALTLGHALATSVRRHRRVLAVLKTVGFTRGQVRATVAWQATTVAILALAVGLPSGAVGGRWLWRVFAAQLGVATDPLTPLVPLVLAVPITVLVANLAAGIPAWRGGRIRPAAVLRAD